MDSAITHIAGAQVQVGSRLRQRCSWCGMTLADYDLAGIAVPLGQDPRPAMWEAGELVEVDGCASFAVAHEDGAELPANACERLGLDVEAPGFPASPEPWTPEQVAEFRRQWDEMQQNVQAKVTWLPGGPGPDTRHASAN